jgi:hypothetical protein
MEKSVEILDARVVRTQHIDAIVVNRIQIRRQLYDFDLGAAV